MAGWFMPERVPYGPVRLFCFPHAGGGASAYRAWTKESALGAVPVQLPGRENRMRETPLLSMRAIVEQAAEAIRPYAGQRYALFGHSLGARVVFELARYMRRKGQPLPAHLFVSGSRAPEIPEPSPLHELEEDAFLAALSRYGGTPQSLLDNKELMKLFLPLLRADFTVDETYEYQEEEPLPVPITAFYGSDDPEATRGETEGWERHTSGGFSLHEIPGGHFYLTHSSPLLLSYIRRVLGV